MSSVDAFRVWGASEYDVHVHTEGGGGGGNTPKSVDKLGMNDLCGQRGRGSQKLINCFGLSSWVLDVKYESPLSLALSSAEAREAGVP